MIIFQIGIALILTFIILRQPYFGLVFTIASLPVISLLPQIPFLSSFLTLIGALTLIAFLLRRVRESDKPLFRFGNVHVLGLLLIVWIFLSNPQAAVFGNTRNWLFTYVQLWILIWLASELLDTQEKLIVLMWVFSVASIVSAIFAISTGSVGNSVLNSTRASGLVGGVNEAGRLFVVSMVFLVYLRTVANTRLFQFIATVGMGITVIGVFFTLSRTGILLLCVAIGLLVSMQSNIKTKFKLIIIFIIIISILLLFTNNIPSILRTIPQSILEGSDTIGLRYRLWQSGWRMWLDNPLTGVGIGKYPEKLSTYSQGTIPLVFVNHGIVTHNMYIQMLAETGIIGFSFFVFLLILSLQNIWSVRKIGDDNNFLLCNVWVVVFLVMILGGITKSDQFDKLIWLTMGVSISLRNQIIPRKNKLVYKDKNRLELYSRNHRKREMSQKYNVPDMRNDSA